ncbi:hypothetical protein GCM10027589_07230 [Actinocorallia lasiicapitis]
MDEEEVELVGVLTLPGHVRSVRFARGFCRDMLGERFPGLDDVQMCVSEAVTNGVVHSRSGKGGKVSVALYALPDGVVVEVVDDGSENGDVPVVRCDPDGEGGRGLHIIDALARKWRVRKAGDATHVAMEFDGRIPRER